MSKSVHMMKRILFLSDCLYILEMFKLEYKVNNGVLCSFIVVLIAMSAFFTGSGRAGGQLLGKDHRTLGAQEKPKDLWCYHCNTMEGGGGCEGLADNRTDYHLKCRDERTCMVKSISLTTSTGNSTSTPKLWLLERNCSKHCEPGCIVIGERTKIYACTKCCEADFCNSGKSGTKATAKCVHHFNAVILAVLAIKSVLF